MKNHCTCNPSHKNLDLSVFGYEPLFCEALLISLFLPIEKKNLKESMTLTPRFNSSRKLLMGKVL